MGLNYDLGDKSENLRRMNHFKKFNKANRKFCWQNLIISIVSCFNLQFFFDYLTQALKYSSFRNYHSFKKSVFTILNFSWIFFLSPCPKYPFKGPPPLLVRVINVIVSLNYSLVGCERIVPVMIYLCQCTLQCTVYSVQCTVYTTVYNVQFTVYTI